MDARRTYANLLEAAGIPRTRKRMYVGHGVRDVTEQYERHAARPNHSFPGKEPSLSRFTATSRSPSAAAISAPESEGTVQVRTIKHNISLIVKAGTRSPSRATTTQNDLDTH